MVDTNLLWKPLLEAAGQTLLGALGSIAFSKLVMNIRKRDVFEGPMDLWCMGINENIIEDGSNIFFDGIISPYTQLFSGNPFNNATR